jgi:hypothetical protein
MGGQGVEGRLGQAHGPQSVAVAVGARQPPEARGGQLARTLLLWRQGDASTYNKTVWECRVRMVRPAGIEPATPGFGGQYSIH